MGSGSSKHGIQMQENKSWDKQWITKSISNIKMEEAGVEAGWHGNGVGRNATSGRQRKKRY